MKKIILLLSFLFVANFAWTQSLITSKYHARVYQKENISSENKKSIGSYHLLGITETSLKLGQYIPQYTATTKKGKRAEKKERANDPSFWILKTFEFPLTEIRKIVVDEEKTEAACGLFSLASIGGTIYYSTTISSVALAIGSGLLGVGIVVPAVAAAFHAIVHPAAFKTQNTNYEFLKDKLTPYLSSVPLGITTQ